MVIDLMPTDRLCHFTNTIKWLRSEEIWSSDVLPSIILAVQKKICFINNLHWIFVSIKKRMAPIVQASFGFMTWSICL